MSLFVCSKSINARYEEYVLQGGDFDERVFLGADADAEIGTPAKTPSSMGSEIRERMVDASMKQHFQEVGECLLLVFGSVVASV